MIVKNETDVERFIANEGVCGEDGEYCSQSCAEHGRHVAIANGRVFARGMTHRRSRDTAADAATTHEVVSLELGRPAVAA